jgi:hypothetical protein
LRAHFSSPDQPAIFIKALQDDYVRWGLRLPSWLLISKEEEEQLTPAGESPNIKRSREEFEEAGHQWSELCVLPPSKRTRLQESSPTMPVGQQDLRTSTTSTDIRKNGVIKH